MNAQRTFRLYPEEKHWCSFADYGAVLDTMRRLQATQVLEFGPGSSTLALLEGGAHFIDACEDDPHWLKMNTERLSRYLPKQSGVLAMCAYEWSDPVSVPYVDKGTGRYDLGLVDGPADIAKRPAVIEYCIPRCKHVLVPLEESEGDLLTLFCIQLLNRERIQAMEIFNTGPLAGSFALLTC